MQEPQFSEAPESENRLEIGEKTEEVSDLICLIGYKGT